MLDVTFVYGIDNALRLKYYQIHYYESKVSFF